MMKASMAMHAVPPRPSLIAHSADFLREALLRGEWQEALPSERTLCARLRISRPTLRAVLSQLEREGVIGEVESKKRRILTQPTTSERADASRLIALVSPVPQQAMPAWVLFWLDALRELLSIAGYQLEVHAAAHCYSARPAAGLKKLTQRVQASVWVLFRSTPAMQRWFVETGTASVIAGSCAPTIELPSVDLDYRAICRHAVVMLRQKGHRRIALLLPDAAHGGDVESALGFHEAPGTVDLLIVHHRETVNDVVACLENLLRGRRPPTAFLVARSTHTLTVLTHLLRQGHRVPEEYAVVSRDDDAFLDHVIPKVSRYSADAARFAKQLSKRVLELAQTRSTSRQAVRLMPDFRRGETV